MLSETYIVKHYIFFFFNYLQVKINQIENHKYVGKYVLFREGVSKFSKGVHIATARNMIIIYYPNDGKGFLFFIECAYLLTTS